MGILWRVLPLEEVPQWFLKAVQSYPQATYGGYVAQLLWQRGIRTREQLASFMDPSAYQPTSPFAFGQEMKRAVRRLEQARREGEKVAIWGDFDADGITSTSVLWEVLREFFPHHGQLTYYIPNRLTESHGLNEGGIDKLVTWGTKLIVTCDTGSTNLKEIDYAGQLGIDIIITDHHTLLPERPPVVSIINPRYFAPTHPLFHLSGVAVAYKLVEALYVSFPDIPQQPREDLLDLVAIGLVADLVQLSGDCRYLAQLGIEKLQQTKRPGVAYLLQLCKRSGDRPMDISFGLGPRINAVSRIQGDASFCVELLTSRDPQRCKELAAQTELANTRRKSLQKEITEQVKKKLAQIDLSTTSVIVLEDPQWQGGVLGLVAGQIAQEYGRPTILLSSQDNLARGSARSVNNIDLYELVQSQAHLLERFGGHPFAAGLSLPVDNIPLLREGIDRHLRQQIADVSNMTPMVTADLTIKVSDLSQALFRELKLLEPCGMGNPVPKLLIKNCWFEHVGHENDQDFRGKKVQYLKTTFLLWDDSVEEGFPGIWWGKNKDELPQDKQWDAIVELDFNTYKERYEVRLIAVRETKDDSFGYKGMLPFELIMDCRRKQQESEVIEGAIGMEECPASWEEMARGYEKVIAQEGKLALTYPPPQQLPPSEIWQQLVGIAKYLSRTGQIARRDQLRAKLQLSDRTLDLGMLALTALGFNCTHTEESMQWSWSENVLSELVDERISAFLEAVREEQFQQQYFWRVPKAVSSYQ